MSERSYTVGELDELRRAVENKWLYGSYCRPHSGCSRSFREDEKTKCVEQIVRTHMIAGHTAADLYESERQAREVWEKQLAEWKAKQPEPAPEPQPEPSKPVTIAPHAWTGETN